jgi:hypothetical protein
MPVCGSALGVRAGTRAEGWDCAELRGGGVQLPVAWYAFEVVGAAWFECEARPYDEVFDGLGDEYLVGRCVGCETPPISGSGLVDNFAVRAHRDRALGMGSGEEERQWRPANPHPSRAARSTPAASMTARTSSIRVSKSGACAMRSDIPVPRLSKCKTRKLRESRRMNRANRGCSQYTSKWEIQPWMTTKVTGPSPTS